MSVEINNETDWGQDPQEFVDLVNYCLEQLHVSPAAEVNILMVEPQAMADLHVKWMDLPGPTDVLSFPMDATSCCAPRWPPSRRATRATAAKKRCCC